MLEPLALDALLNSLPSVRVGVIGDFCVDAYWTMDNAASETSIETGLPTRPVRSQRYELGGAGTIVNNLVALGVGTVEVFGIIGNDPFGREMERLMAAKGVRHTGLLTQPGDWDTLVYTKPILADREESRIDFGNYNRLRDELATALLARLEAALPALDIVIVNQQILRGIHTDFLRAALNQLIARHPAKPFIVDCRHITGAYAGCLQRLNEFEATKLGGDAGQLYARAGRPVFLSRGARGVVVADATGVHAIPGLHIINPTDPVGAGDSMLAGIAAAIAAGHTPVQAATFGNFVAGVTVQKLFQTGTASPAEIRAIGASPDYVYEPDLAEDPRRARYYRDTEIEIVVDLPADFRLTHAIFDYDGTLSTVRQGWEHVMEPVMVRAILGPRYADADEALYNRVVQRVRDYIDKTTGIQTLVQMQGLVRLVREFGLVPAAEILDEHGYKATYNQALTQLVRTRISKVERGELDIGDVVMKNTFPLLDRLEAAGVALYLASGTDREDVAREAEALGVARYFGQHIYGAVGDVTKEAKRMVLDRILNEIGDARSVVAFGDGPVEIRETRKRGGLTIGVASDEIRRYGLNPGKRARLIRAGAHVIVPDYSQLNALLTLLRIR